MPKTLSWVSGSTAPSRPQLLVGTVESPATGVRSLFCTMKCATFWQYSEHTGSQTLGSKSCSHTEDWRLFGRQVGPRSGAGSAWGGPGTSCARKMDVLKDFLSNWNIKKHNDCNGAQRTVYVAHFDDQKKKIERQGIKKWKEGRKEKERKKETEREAHFPPFEASMTPYRCICSFQGFTGWHYW